jgi:hypothetical protein
MSPTAFYTLKLVAETATVAGVAAEAGQKLSVRALSVE